MKLTNTNEIKTNVSKAQHASIKMSPTAFKILSSQIYSNKIKAVIREISCNAHDAHVTAGKIDLPINVALPTRFNPTFEVEDFGTGLPHETLVELYMTYFGSTKQDTNDEIGGFGLGSKSPLAYTDQFTVINTYNGVRKTYMVYFNAEHVPDVSEIGSVEVDEPNGIKVIVPVQDSDVSRFVNEAANVYSWFKVKPNIIRHSNEDFDIYTHWVDHTANIDYSKDYFFCQQSEYSMNSKSIIAYIGGVVYPVYDVLDKSEFDIFRSMIDYSRSTLVVRFDIGEVEVSASRETLSMDRRTEEKVYNKLKSISDLLVKDIQSKIDECKVPGDLKETIGEYRYNIVINHTKSFEFKCKPLASYYINYTSKIVRKLYTQGGYLPTIYKLSGSYSRVNCKLRQLYNDYFNPFTNTKICFLIADQKKGIQHIRNHLVDNSDYDDIYEVQPCDVEKVKIHFYNFDYEFKSVKVLYDPGIKPTRTKQQTKYSDQPVIYNGNYQRMEFDDMVENALKDNTYVVGTHMGQVDWKDFGPLLKLDSTINLLVCSETNCKRLIKKGATDIKDIEMKPEYVDIIKSAHELNQALYTININYSLDYVNKDFIKHSNGLSEVIDGFEVFDRVREILNESTPTFDPKTLYKFFGKDEIEKVLDDIDIDIEPYEKMVAEVDSKIEYLCSIADIFGNDINDIRQTMWYEERKPDLFAYFKMKMETN